MKRLFFLIVLIFVGFGAFGYTHSDTHFHVPNNQLFNLSAYSSRALYADTIPKRKRVDEWYLSKNSYDMARLAFDFGGNHTMLKDDFVSEIPYSGFGFHGLLSAEVITPSFAYFSNLYLQITPMQPSKSYRDIIQSSESLDYDVLYFNSYLNIDILFRMAKTPHYIGSHMNLNLSGGSYYLPPEEEISMSIGFAHTYYRRIFGIPTRVNTTLPIIIGATTANLPFFTDFFNPIIDITWFFNSKFNENIDFALSYTFNYLNINRNFSNYRNMTNAISVGVSYYK